MLILNCSRYYVVICLLILSLSGISQYTIHGKIAGLKEGEKVIMLLATKGRGFYEQQLVPADSAYVINGEFVLNGVVSDGPRGYQMVFDKHKNGSGDYYKIINMAINNNERITISSGDIDKIPHAYIEHYVDIQGSPTHYSFMCLYTAEEYYWQATGTLRNNIKLMQDSIGFSGPLMDVAFACKTLLNNTFFYNYFSKDIDPERMTSNVLLPAGMSIFQRSGHASFWIEFYNNLDDKKKKSFYGQWLKELTRFCIGEPISEFTLPQLNGKSLSLKEIFVKSKLTVIQFWGSNSFRRRERQEELKVLYNKYHEKGLDIIGVSSDKYHEQWAETLNTEKLPWYNVVDKNGKMTLETYFEPEGSTTNVLIDSQGKIIAWDVSGPELQWHLWKVFEK